MIRLFTTLFLIGNVTGQKNRSLDQIQDCLSSLNGKVNMVTSHFGLIDFDSLYQKVQI